MKVMRKILEVIVTLIVLTALIVAGLAFYYKDILIPAFTKPEVISEQQTQSSNALKEKINEYIEEPIRDFTEEETAAIESKEKTASEVIAKIVMEHPVKEEEGPTKESLTVSYTSKMYELQSKYTGQIEGVIAAAKADYEAQTASGTSGSIAKSSTMATYGNQLRSLQSQCDGEVNTLLEEFTNALNGIGADTGITTTMRAAYNNAKSVTISKYMSMYRD